MQKRSGLKAPESLIKLVCGKHRKCRKELKRCLVYAAKAGLYRSTPAWVVYRKVMAAQATAKTKREKKALAPKIAAYKKQLKALC
jgi:hypothetical protein